MDKEDFFIIITIICVIGCACTGIYYLIHSSEIDYSESCMREMAVIHCESEGMYFNHYASGTFDGEYFRCVEKGRDGLIRRFDYSSKEIDNCRIKDANSLKNYKSKWELNDVNVLEGEE